MTTVSGLTLTEGGREGGMERSKYILLCGSSGYDL